MEGLAPDESRGAPGRSDPLRRRRYFVALQWGESRVIPVTKIKVCGFCHPSRQSDLHAPVTCQLRSGVTGIAVLY